MVPPPWPDPLLPALGEPPPWGLLAPPLPAALRPPSPLSALPLSPLSPPFSLPGGGPSCSSSIPSRLLHAASATTKAAGLIRANRRAAFRELIRGRTARAIRSSLSRTRSRVQRPRPCSSLCPNQR